MKTQKQFSFSWNIIISFLKEVLVVKNRDFTGRLTIRTRAITSFLKAKEKWFIKYLINIFLIIKPVFKNNYNSKYYELNENRI